MGRYSCFDWRRAHQKLDYRKQRMRAAQARPVDGQQAQKDRKQQQQPKKCREGIRTGRKVNVFFNKGTRIERKEKVLLRQKMVVLRSREKVHRSDCHLKKQHGKKRARRTWE